MEHTGREPTFYLRWFLGKPPPEPRGPHEVEPGSVVHLEDPRTQDAETISFTTGGSESGLPWPYLPASPEERSDKIDQFVVTLGRDVHTRMVGMCAWIGRNRGKGDQYIDGMRFAPPSPKRCRADTVRHIPTKHAT